MARTWKEGKRVPATVLAEMEMNGVLKILRRYIWSKMRVGLALLQTLHLNTEQFTISMLIVIEEE